MFLKKFNGHNRQATYAQIQETIEFLCKEDPEGFGKFSREAQLRLGMQHYQCERGRLQRSKLYVDVVAHIIPFLMALAALLFAIK